MQFRSRTMNSKLFLNHVCFMLKPPEASFLSLIFLLSMMSKKEGHPDPESYLEALVKCWMLQTTQVYTPFSRCL